MKIEDDPFDLMIDQIEQNRDVIDSFDIEADELVAEEEGETSLVPSYVFEEAVILDDNVTIVGNEEVVTLDDNVSTVMESEIEEVYPSATRYKHRKVNRPNRYD